MGNSDDELLADFFKHRLATRWVNGANGQAKMWSNSGNASGVRIAQGVEKCQSRRMIAGAAKIAAKSSATVRLQFMP
jgi:hypothetical protein